MTRVTAPSPTDAVEVAVVFDRFGPYHQARLRAASKHLRLLAVEVYGESREYAWDPVQDGTDLRRVTLFPDADSTSVAASECRERLFALFDETLPSAVAVPGWSTPAALSALAWCGERRRPAIIMSESTRWDEPRRWWKEKVKRRLVGGCGSAGLVGGYPHVDYLVEFGIPRERVFTGYDAVDNDYFATRAAEVRADESALRIQYGLPARYFLASNRFIEKKNLFRLLTAYAAYCRGAGETAWSLVLLGDGPLRESIEQQRSELSLESKVHLPGFKQYGELPLYYGLASGFIHASTTEQWGLVVNEAMASGLPVLVSNRCGCAVDLVTEGAQGWTFDPFNVPAITEALTKLSSLPDDGRAAMGTAARTRIAAWSTDAFATGLRQAVEAGKAAPPRRISLLDRLLLGAMLRR